MPRRMDSNSNSTGNNRSSNNSRRGGRGRVNTSNFPVEEGIICSLKESFGFIHCADRPLEIFFHYSEVASCHPDDLQIDTEVEFRVGSTTSDETKLAAYQVNTLPTGTIVWETEEEPEKLYQGLVERNIYSDSRGNSNNGMEGTIRVMLDDDENKEEEKEKTSTKMVRFRAQDIDTSNIKSSRLFRGDLVQFRILTDRRTKQNYARFITLLQTEKERTRIEKEKKLMETATAEEGVVISLNKGFGFIKSNKRREHVYFHYSNLIVPEDDDGKQFELKKGQEMKFLVVTEMKDGESKCSGRALECLPKGSVVFHTVVAQGVKGRVTLCPLPPSAGNTGYADDKNGNVRLLEPIVDASAGEDANTIQDISLEFSDTPGGVYTFQQRGAPVNGVWILEGDMLLFDVVKELADGSYRAAPTLHTLENGGAVQPPSDTTEESTAMVRLVALSLVGRAEGTMQALKVSGGYGFIHYAERPIDVHFNTYNLLPDELQSDLRKQLGVDGMPVNLEVGVGVQFDICAHGTVSSGNARGRGRGGNPHERENVKAHRVLLLPASLVTMDKTIATGVKGVVKSADSKQLYAGFLDLEDELEPMSLEEQHPLLAQMIDSFLEESSKPTGRNQLVYRDILSMKEDDVVVEMVKKKGSGFLTCDHITVAGIAPHPGRMCIRRVDEAKETQNKEEEVKPTPSKKKQAKPNKNVRFDKSSLGKDLEKDIPPATGDIVTCDIIQSRRTGKFVVHNLKVVERKKLDDDAAELASTETSGLGVVKDVVPKSNFGFISVLDENATKRELLYFHLSDKKSKRSGPPLFRKGDEVKFDIGVEKSGKRVAANVQIIPKGTIPSKPASNACRGFVLMVPSHTSLSDTPLRKQQSGASSQGSDRSGGRWGNVKEESQKTPHKDIHEEGCILLLEDKSGMFKNRTRNRKRGTSVGSTDDDTRSTDSIDDDMKSVDDDLKSGDETENLEQDGEDSILARLAYKNGSIAIHGMGASCSMDTSTNPRRGDLISFVKAKRGNFVRDIRVVTRQAATMLRGRLENIEMLIPGENAGEAKFVAATEKEEHYDIDLTEVVGCDVALLKEKETVEGILHEGKIYGVCRTKDIMLSSKLAGSGRERQKLNLVVKKTRGGKIIAQSMMAKGPDGTNGFAPGWTTRTSQYSGFQGATTS
jgi:cold shock CspA family protein